MPKAGKSDIERVPSGVTGLDPLIEGGLVKGSTSLITGGAGTGKTILCAQFIWEGLKRGETCLFITLEERVQDIIDDVRRFGWDFEEYIRKGKLFLEYRDPFEVTDITGPLIDKVRAYKITRVAVDSTSALGMYYTNPFEVRKQLFKLLMTIKDTGATSFLTAEVADEGTKLSRFGVEEFVTDAVIMLHYLGIGGGSYHSVQVRKMRQTAHEKDIFPMEIVSGKGIVIKKNSV